MKRHALATIAASVALGILVTACGGPPAQPNTPDPPLGPTTTPPAGTGTAKPEGPTAGPGDDITRGNAAVKAGDWNGARSAFEAAIKKNPKQPEGYFYLGVVMDQTGDKAAAEKNYKQALDLQPDLLDAAQNLTAIYVDSQRYDEAIVLAKKALARNAKDSGMQLNLAVGLSGKGDVDGASRAFEDALKLAPNDARFYIAYADHLRATRKNDEAIAKLRQAQRVAGDDPALLGTIGLAFRDARAVPDCIAAFDKAIAIKDNPDFRTIRALCKLGGKDRPGALADLQNAAAAKDPPYAPAHYWLASMLHEDGKYPEAVAEYDAYLKAAPKGPMAKMAEAKLKLAKEKKKPEKPAPKK